MTSRKDNLKNRLITIFQNSTNLNHLIDIYGDELDEIEAALLAIQNLRIENASGKILDDLGILLSAIKRGALSDDEYRQFLYLQILINIYKGTTEELLSFLTTIGATEVYVYELGFATLKIYYNNIEVDILNLLRLGTHPITFILYKIESPFFGFIGNPNAKGFGEGKLSKLI